jgi:AAA15 family ATPase/GTPase
MIKSLHIKNFQSHKNTNLFFHPGVNVIIGESDTGKSAILRALSWLVRNKVDDKSFRSNWGGKTDVEVKFEDGNEVSRTQDKNNCYYLMNPNTGIDEEYKAFRSDIPEDIVEVLNMDVLNMSYQFDPPFLLSDSPGEVAKTLNKIADLNDIDTSIANIRKMVLANSREISGLEFQLEELNKSKETLSFLSEMEKDVTELEQFLHIETKCVFQINIGNKLINSISKIEAELKELDLFLAADKEVTKVSALVDREKSLTSRARGLESLIKVIETDSKDLEVLNSFLLAETEMKSALKLVEKESELSNNVKRLTLIIKSIENFQLKIKESEKFIAHLSNHIKYVMPKVCPLCDQEIPK